MTSTNDKMLILKNEIRQIVPELQKKVGLSNFTYFTVGIGIGPTGKEQVYADEHPFIPNDASARNFKLEQGEILLKVFSTKPPIVIRTTVGNFEVNEIN